MPVGLFVQILKLVLTVGQGQELCAQKSSKSFILVNLQRAGSGSQLQFVHVLFLLALMDLCRDFAAFILYPLVLSGPQAISSDQWVKGGVHPVQSITRPHGDKHQ